MIMQPSDSEGRPSSSRAAQRLAVKIVGLGLRCSRDQYDLCRLLADYDLSGHWARSGAVTCSRWAADALDVEAGTAREWLRVGHALRDLQVVGAAFAEGRLSYAKVRTLTRVAIDHPDRQEELVDLALGCTASALSAELARWTGKEEDDEERDQRHRREMFLSARTEPDGSHLFTIRLPPLDGARAMARIDAHVHRARPRRPSDGTDPDTDPATGTGTATDTNQNTNAESAGNPTADASAPPSVRTRPTLAQQRAMAFIELLTEPAAGNGSGTAVEYLIHLRGDGATFSDGTPVAGHLVERLAPAAFYRAMVHDANGRPINASARQRHPTTRQKRVVAERDGHRCVEEGCGATEFLEYDHDPPFEISKHTVVDELQLRCGSHHRDRHRREDG
jgi:hypothetical protein